MTETTRWEYRLENLGSFWNGPKDEALQDILDEMGADGWEVFFVNNPPNSNQYKIFAKRPIASGTSASRRRGTWP